MRRILEQVKKIIILSALGYGLWYAYTYFYISERDRIAGKHLVSGIVQVDSVQVRGLLLSGKHYNRPTLVYIFNSQCMLCRWHYQDIQEFAKKYPRDQLNVLLVSVDKKPEDLAAFLNKVGPSFVKPVMLKPGNEAGIRGETMRLNIKYEADSLPYIGVLNKAGHADTVLFGWDRKNRINLFIQRSLNTKV